MGRKKRDIIEEIENRAEEFVNLLALKKTMMCDPSKNDYVRCVVKKGHVQVEYRKRRDKLVRQLSFGYVTSENIEEKESIENIVNAMIQLGLITEEEWMKAINDALRYVNKLDGMEPRTRVRRIAEENKILEEDGFR
jgi:hypothetical protein